MKKPNPQSLDQMSPIGNNEGRLRVIQTEEFTTWLTALRDHKARNVIATRMRRLELGNFGDVEPIGAGVSEMRVHCGPGYRLYIARHGSSVVIVLAGGDKGSQNRDIKAAKQQWQTLKTLLEAGR